MASFILQPGKDRYAQGLFLLLVTRHICWAWQASGLAGLSLKASIADLHSEHVPWGLEVRVFGVRASNS